MTTIMKKALIISAALLFAAASLPAQQSPGAPQVRAVVKPVEATIGDVLEYRVSIAGKNLGKVAILLPDSRIAYPAKEPADKKMPEQKSGEETENPADSVPLYIIHNAKKDDRSDKDVTDITIILELSYYRPGKHQLPEVEIRDTDKVKIGYKIPEVTIKSLNQKGEFQEIEPPLELSGNYTRLILLIAGIVALTVLGVFAYRKVRAMIRARREEIPPVPPIVQFREEMAQLKARELIDEGRIEEYVFGISMIFRRYLSRRFRFDATDMTSDEILSMMSRLPERGKYAKHTGDIGTCFNLWDLSKFAEFSPSREMLLMNLELAEKLAENINEVNGDAGNGTPGV